MKKITEDFLDGMSVDQATTAILRLAALENDGTVVIDEGDHQVTFIVTPSGGSDYNFTDKLVFTDGSPPIIDTEDTISLGDVQSLISWRLQLIGAI